MISSTPQLQQTAAATSSSASRARSSSSVNSRSYVEYLEDVGGPAGVGDDLKRLDVSGGSTSDLGLMTLSTPDHHPKSNQSQNNNNDTNHSNRSTLVTSPQPTESRSFVNGLLSPFSPLLKQKDQRDEYLKYLSLQPCRKVSVVVRILPCGNDNEGADERQQQQRCVFPHIKTSPSTSTSSTLIRKPKPPPRNMVVVNPSAFGKKIPNHVTMDTARLVAQVAHISSEDWARLYEFHHVMWPSPTTSSSTGEDQSPSSQKQNPASPTNNNGNVADEFSTLDSLSRAVTQDALVEFQSSLIISLGQGNTCMGSEYGVWPRVINHCQAWMEEASVCTLSMYEILEEKDCFRDLLNRRNKDLSLRHVDMKGAVLEGLTQAPIDSMSALLESLLKRKKSKNTIIGTLNIWSNAVSYELKKTPNAQITCVELAGGDVTPIKRNGKGGGVGEAIVHRQSTMYLGQALRALLLHASFGTEPAISFRDTSLTKVLQRSLESSKIVLLASISQLSKDYESTIATLNYLRRLLVKPGQTASSPFKHQLQYQYAQQDGSGGSTAITTPSPKQLEKYANQGILLKNLVSDPRQRLAKVMKGTPPSQPNVRDSNFQSPLLDGDDPDYVPIDYMNDWDKQSSKRQSVPKAWESPPAKTTMTKKGAGSTSTPNNSTAMSGGRGSPDSLLRRSRRERLEFERRRNLKEKSTMIHDLQLSTTEQQPEVDVDESTPADSEYFLPERQEKTTPPSPYGLAPVQQDHGENNQSRNDTPLDEPENENSYEEETRIQYTDDSTSNQGEEEEIQVYDRSDGGNLLDDQVQEQGHEHQPYQNYSEDPDPPLWRDDPRAAGATTKNGESLEATPPHDLYVTEENDDGGSRASSDGPPPQTYEEDSNIYYQEEQEQGDEVAEREEHEVEEEGVIWEFQDGGDPDGPNNIEDIPDSSMNYSNQSGWMPEETGASINNDYSNQDQPYGDGYDDDGGSPDVATNQSPSDEIHPSLNNLEYSETEYAAAPEPDVAPAAESYSDNNEGGYELYSAEQQPHVSSYESVELALVPAAEESYNEDEGARGLYNTDQNVYSSSYESADPGVARDAENHDGDENGHELYDLDQQPYSSSYESATSTEFYVRSEEKDSDADTTELETKDSLRTEDSWEQKAKGPVQIQWLPDVTDDRENEFLHGGSLQQQLPGDANYQSDERLVDGYQQSEQAEADNKQDSAREEVPEEEGADKQEEFYDSMEVGRERSDTEEEEIYFDDDPPELRAESDVQEDPPKDDSQLYPNGSGSISQATDPLHSSLFTEWGSDHGDGEDLDLEPQTEYELPESPRPSPDGTEEEDWYASPSRVNDGGTPLPRASSRATTPRSSNREKRRSSPVISNRSDKSTSRLQQQRITGESKSELSSVSQSNTKRTEATISSRSAFSSVSSGTRDGLRPPRVPRPNDSPIPGEERSSEPDSPLPEIRTNLFAVTEDSKSPPGQYLGDNNHDHKDPSYLQSRSPLRSVGRASPHHTEESVQNESSKVATKEIETLESFVGQIQDMHKGLWKSSALSLHRLKESLQSQGSELGQLLSERESLLSEVAEAREDNRRISQQHEDQILRFEQEVEELQIKLNKTMHDKADVEKIADEAISAQDTLERRVNSLHEELNASRMKTEFTREEIEDLKQTVDDLRRQVQEITSQRDSLDLSNEEGIKNCASLESSLRRLEEEKVRSEKAQSADKATIEDLKSRLKQREVEMGKLKEDREKVERLRRDDRSQLESLVDRSRNLGTALESVRKERSRLEEDRREDRNLIRELQDELRSLKKRCANLESEHSKCHELQLEKEARFDTIQSQYREVRIQFESLQTEYDNTVESRKEQIVETEHMQRELKRLRSTVKDYEAEKARLKESRREDQTKIRRLEGELRSTGTKSEEEVRRLEKELSRQKKDKEDIEILMAKKKEDYADSLHGKEAEIAHFKELSDVLERELRETEKRARLTATESDSELADLRNRLGDYETELDLCIRQRDDIALKLESTEESIAVMTSNLEEKERQLTDSQEETRRVEKELDDLQDKECSRAAAAEREHERIQKTRSELETKLSEARQQRDDARNDLHKECLSRQSLYNELERTKENLKRQQDAVEQLSHDLHLSRVEKASDDQRISSMESSLNQFRSEAQEKLEKVVRDHRESKDMFERERGQIRLLKDQNRNLQSEYQKVKRERDLLINSLQSGRSRLAAMATKSVASSMSHSELHGDDPLYATVPTTNIEFGTHHLAPVEEAQELYITDFSTGDLASLRAEEIVSYLAMSAKSSLQESQEEASQLRSQVYRLEEEKESEVASLKTRIRLLERQVSNPESFKGRTTSNSSRRARNTYQS